MMFEDWLARKGFLNPHVLESNRCPIHGYTRNGVYHYPTLENTRSFYTCRHCLENQFAALTLEEADATIEHSLMINTPASPVTSAPASNPELDNWQW